MVFHYNFFSDDAHIEQIAIEHLFTVTEAGIEAGMGVWITHQGYLIAHLQHRVTIRVGKNAVATDTFNVTTGLTINTQFAQIFTIGPCHQLRANAIGANHREVNFTIGVSIQAPFTRDLLGAGLQILMLKFRQIARTNNQTDQTNQIGEGVTQAQVIESA